MKQSQTIVTILFFVVSAAKGSITQLYNFGSDITFFYVINGGNIDVVSSGRLKGITNPTGDFVVGSDAEYCPLKVYDYQIPKVKNLRTDTCFYQNPDTDPNWQYGMALSCCQVGMIEYDDLSKILKFSFDANTETSVPLRMINTNGSYSNYYFNFITNSNHQTYATFSSEYKDSEFKVPSLGPFEQTPYTLSACPYSSTYCTQNYENDAFLWISPTVGSHFIVFRRFTTPSKYDVVYTFNRANTASKSSSILFESTSDGFTA